MSVSIATMGMFNQCCGGTGFGGGAPPYRAEGYDSRSHPTILVKDVEMKTKNDIEDYLSKIKVKLIDVD
jgi:hypothetical protein